MLILEFGEPSDEAQSRGNGCTYNVIPTLVNTADYGIPQKRERVFLIGFRDDLGVEWSFPTPTHSYAALLHDRWVSGKYWQRHNLPVPPLPSKLVRQVEKIKQGLLFQTSLPWRTARDAIGDLPNPQSQGATLTIP